MGLRETLNQNPRLATGLTVGFIVVALGLMIWQLLPGGGGDTAEGGGVRYYYTEDDGATLFAADPMKIPPFTGPNGKEAVRAHVYKCGEKQIVGWLEKFSPQGKQQLDQYYSQPENSKRSALDLEDDRHRMVKSPGKPQWFAVEKFGEVANRIKTVKCDNGAQPVEVYPE